VERIPQGVKSGIKRINKRIKELDLGNIQAYGEYAENHGEEMKVLDAIFNITIIDIMSL
jgi:hypothetical protein